MNIRLLSINLLAACTIASASAGAADWTRTIDLSKNEAVVTGLGGAVDATAEAFWIGPDYALDATTGATLVPHALPERVSLLEDGTVAFSSTRGRLWLKPDNRVSGGWELDVDGNLWGLAGGKVMRVAADGAQEQHWSGTSFGLPGFYVASMDLDPGRGEAVVLLAPTGPSTLENRMVRFDARGRILKSLSTPNCTEQVFDDRRGGHYEVCLTGGVFLHREVVRIGADGQLLWSTPVEGSIASHFDVLDNGDLLVDNGGRVEIYGPDRLPLIAADATMVAAAGDSFWLWSSANLQLRHLHRNGSELGRTTVADVQQLAAHASGSALIAVDRPDASGDEHFRLYAADARQIRRVEPVRELAPTQTRLHLNDGLPYAEADGQPNLVNLIDDLGRPASAPFPLQLSGVLEQTGPILANDQLVCVQRTFLTIGSGIPVGQHVQCYRRSSGASAMQIDSSFGFQTLIGVGDAIHIRHNDSIGAYDSNGRELARIPIAGAADYAVHPRHGLAVLGGSANPGELWLFSPQGQLRATYRTSGISIGDRVFLGEDGSAIIVARGTEWTHIDAAGRVLGTASVRPAAYLDVRMSAHGVAVLTAASTTAAAPIHLNLLAPDLSPRTTPIRLPDARKEHTALAIDGSRLAVAVAGKPGLQWRTFDLASGAQLDRRVFALHPDALRRLPPGRFFSIATSAALRVVDIDAASKRDVLRVFEPGNAAFNAPIRQTALSGSWYAPSSTGQGLIVDLLNGGTQLFAAWHTYAPEGGNSLAKQQWLSVQGQVGAARGALTLPIYRNSGGRFDVVGMTDAVAVGTADLVFTSCDRMEFWYRIGDEMGALPLQRLTPRTLPCDNGSTIEAAVDAAPAIDLTGPWYDPSRSGQGLAVSASGTQFNQFFAGWFTYDAEHADDPDAQHWFSLQGANPARYGDPVPARIYRTVGGSRSGEPTRNTHVVGSAQLTVHDCGHATLDYVFDDSVVAGAFANQSRSVPLVRLGSCVN